MLKLLAYRIQQLGGGRKTPNLKNWNYCSAGKTTLALILLHRELARVGGLNPMMEAEEQQGEDPPPHPKKHLGS